MATSAVNESGPVSTFVGLDAAPIFETAARMESMDCCVAVPERGTATEADTVAESGGGGGGFGGGGGDDGVAADVTGVPKKAVRRASATAGADAEVVAAISTRTRTRAVGWGVGNETPGAPTAIATAAAAAGEPRIAATEAAAEASRPTLVTEKDMAVSEVGVAMIWETGMPRAEATLWAAAARREAVMGPPPGERDTVADTSMSVGTKLAGVDPEGRTIPALATEAMAASMAEAVMAAIGAATVARATETTGGGGGGAGGGRGRGGGGGDASVVSIATEPAMTEAEDAAAARAALTASPDRAAERADATSVGVAEARTPTVVTTVTVADTGEASAAGARAARKAPVEMACAALGAAVTEGPTDTETVARPPSDTDATRMRFGDNPRNAAIAATDAGVTSVTSKVRMMSVTRESATASPPAATSKA
jgi:hypothetical protein